MEEYYRCCFKKIMAGATCVPPSISQPPLARWQGFAAVLTSNLGGGVAVTVERKGYRLTTTRSMVPILWAACGQARP